MNHSIIRHGKRPASTLFRSAVKATAARPSIRRGGLTVGVPFVAALNHKLGTSQQIYTTAGNPTGGAIRSFATVVSSTVQQKPTTATMRALRYHGVKDLRVDNDIPVPACGEHQIKIKPAFCGICGTDLHEYSSPTFIPAKDHPHPVTGESMPVTIGHEFSGEVVEIGSKVKNPKGLKVGDKVAVQPTVACFHCGPCNEGYINCCDSAGFVGLSGGGGGMSDYVSVDEQFVFPLPEHIGLDVGALVEPLAVAWHGVNQYPVKEGTSAIVMGAGPIGLGVIQCLKARGASTIIVVEIAKERQNFAKEFGATHLIDPRHEDVVKRAKELTDGQGPHLALDAAGVPASLKTATLAVRARGTVVNLAIWEKEVPFQPNNLVFGEKKYVGGPGYRAKKKCIYCNSNLEPTTFWFKSKKLSLVEAPIP
ncbi:(R,R)-butanediol dehydrogenase [Exophiala dermatitidis]